MRSKNKANKNGGKKKCGGKKKMRSKNKANKNGGKKKWRLKKVRVKKKLKVNDIL